VTATRTSNSRAQAQARRRGPLTTASRSTNLIAAASRRRRALIAALLLTACTLACGVRTDPRPPEETAPRPPHDLEARVVPGGVHLTWERPDRSADGERLWDLIGFVIERRPESGEFAVIHSVPVTDNDRIRPQRDFAFDDADPPTGMLFYRVRGFTSGGQHGYPCAPVLVRIEPEP